MGDDGAVVGGKTKRSGHTRQRIRPCLVAVLPCIDGPCGSPALDLTRGGLCPLCWAYEWHSIRVGLQALCSRTELPPRVSLHSELPIAFVASGERFGWSVPVLRTPLRWNSIVWLVPSASRLAALRARGRPRGRTSRSKRAPLRPLWLAGVVPCSRMRNAKRASGEQDAPHFGPRSGDCPRMERHPPPASGDRAGGGVSEECYLVDPASSHMLVSKIKPCMCKYELIQTVKLRMAH